MNSLTVTQGVDAAQGEHRLDHYSNTTMKNTSRKMLLFWFSMLYFSFVSIEVDIAS